MASLQKCSNNHVWWFNKKLKRTMILLRMLTPPVNIYSCPTMIPAAYGCFDFFEEILTNKANKAYNYLFVFLKYNIVGPLCEHAKFSENRTITLKILLTILHSLQKC